MSKKIRLMIVDDSLLIRQILEKELNKDPQIEVVATASNPIEAKPLILKYKPDVLTLDVEMPQMDGITFLAILQKFHPMPVVMLSTLTAEGSRLAIEALHRGAVEVMHKPGGGSFLALNRVMDELAFKIKAAAVAKRKDFAIPVSPAPMRDGFVSPSKDVVVAIGASTGGTQALRYIMSKLPINMPPIVIVQHMPESFTASFAKTLDRTTEIEVRECTEPMDLRPGLAILAKGGQHMHLMKKMGGYRAYPEYGEPVCHQCPSVDVLFESVAKVVGSNAVGVILTGMGNDGTAGMVAMREAGAYNLAQNEESCVVFGMPKEAIAAGAVHKVVSLDHMAKAIMDAVNVKNGMNFSAKC
jgi:two-component system chemotaxis response regulator CheB